MGVLLTLLFLTFTNCIPVSRDILESDNSPMVKDSNPEDFSTNDTQPRMLYSTALLVGKFNTFRNVPSKVEDKNPSVEKTFMNFFARILEASKIEDKGRTRHLSGHGVQAETKATSGDRTNSPDYYEEYQECRSRLGLINQPLLLVSRCPWIYPNNTIRRLCEEMPDTETDDVLRLSSLSVSDNEANVFANRFCAKCHNVTRIYSWQFSCEFEATDLGRILEADYSLCDIDGVPPFSLESVSCQPSHPSKTNHRRKRASRYGYDETDIINFPVSFSILMNFGFDGKAHILFTEAHHIIETPAEILCPANEIFDPEKRICRAVVCDKGYILKKQKCVEKSPVISTIKPMVGDDFKADDIAQVALEVNVPYEDHFLILSKNFPRLMIAEIGSLFNISQSRIRNFTVLPLQGQGSGNILEIHKYKHTPELKIQQLSPGTEKNLQRTRARQNVKTESTDISRWTTFNISNHNKVHKFMVHHFKVAIDVMIRTLKYPSNQAQTELPNTSTQSTIVSTEDHVFVNATQPKFRMSENETLVDETTGTSVVVKITFLLMPPSKAEKQEKSVVKAVQEMTYMVDKNSFHVNVNNTQISVVGIANEKEPLALTNWCAQGVLSSYDDTKFRLGTVFDPVAQDNITFVYIDETNEVYSPGEYDLLVLLQGSLFYSNSSDVTGYAIVCTKPRLVDKSCRTIRLERGEYEILNHDKTMTDIYTKQVRSIFEYRWASNDSVEICMPNLADKTCGRIKLCESEYDMLDNKSIIYSGDLYNAFQYQNSDNGSVEICIPGNYFADMLDGNITDRVTGCDLAAYKGWLTAEVYLTAALSMISILSMTIVLITYCVFPKLRNLPGTNTMNLTLALMVAELAFEFGSNASNKTACVIVGITLHFFFLASFFWMNIMAYDVYRTFANSCVLTRVRSKGKHLPRYVLYAWGCPAVIVLICCFIDFSCAIKNVHIGYGPTLELNAPIDMNASTLLNQSQSIPVYRYHHQRLGCWIQEPMAALAAFGGPILIILFVNAVFYVKAIMCIHATTRSSLKNTRRSSKRRLTGQNDVIIYVRMSTVMGFTWIIGFTSSFISSVASDGGDVVCLVLRVLTILFTLFNCSQGFLIFFVFVFNRRVGKLYKQLISTKWLAWKKYLKRRHSYSPSSGIRTIS